MFAELSQSFDGVLNQSDMSLRREFYEDPQKTIEHMKEHYPKLGGLSGAQTDYIIKSKYIRDSCAPLLKKIRINLLTRYAGVRKTLMK